MTELEKIEYAKSFIDKLANGINPLNDTPIPEEDVAKNVRLSRCFSYVSSVLGQVVANGQKYEARSKKNKRARFVITPKQLEKFEYSDLPITFGEFCRKMEALVDLSSMRHISRSSLSLWLVHIGLLCPPKTGERHYAGAPTEEGAQLGIAQITYSDDHGTHTANVLGITAQRFIVDNIQSFLAFRERSKLRA